MSLINLLAVVNPSDYWRGGYVVTPWQPIAQQFHLSPDKLILSDLRDRTHVPLLAQVDQIDPNDPSRDMLVFSLPQPIPPTSGSEAIASMLIKIDRGKLRPRGAGEPYLEVVWDPDRRARGVRLINQRLTVWLNLVPDPENNGRNWFAGAATSIQLDHREILDPFQSATGEWMKHDPEKRCLQVAELQLPPPPHPIKSPYYSVPLFNHAYRLVAQNEGPVRASITIASEPFDYMGPDPVTGMNRHLTCELHRVISLYAGADYLIEELVVKGKPKGEEDEPFGAEVVNLSFAVRYFTHMDLGHQPTLYQPPHVEGWFAIGSSVSPYPGYGFATDLHIDAVRYPHKDNEYHLSWQLLPGRSATCLHLFMRGQADAGDARTGRSWYELLYQPLRAEVYQEASSSVLPNDRPNTTQPDHKTTNRTTNRNPASPSKTILVIGYGNSLRGDDIAGQRVADLIATWELPNLQALAVHQLTPELAEQLAMVDLTIFVDAYAASTGHSVCVHPVELAKTGITTGHWCEPSVLLAITQALFGYHPQSWWVTVPGVNFEVSDRLSIVAERGIEGALRQINHLIETYEYQATFNPIAAN
jgi:hydrogenase maturation protease